MAVNKTYYVSNFNKKKIKYIFDKAQLDIGRAKGVFYYGISQKDDEMRFTRKQDSAFSIKEGKMKTVSLSKDGSFEADEFDY